MSPAGSCVVGLGIDIVEVSRIRRMVARHDTATLRLVFTEGEQLRAGDSADPPTHLSVCFGAKESVGKALGTGLAAFRWHEVDSDVHADGLGVDLSGAAADVAIRRRVHRWVAHWRRLGGHVLVSAVALGPTRAI